MQNKKKPLVILTGPTAVGKSDLSILLAKEIGGEVISADSMQVYRHMDIGSAKIKKEEMSDVPHHLIDVLEPSEAFDVYSFKQMALTALNGIYERGNIPIIVGGTGFYIQALLYDIQFTEAEGEDSYRDELQQIADKEGNEVLHQMLKKVDEKAAEEIHPNNVKRVIRALQFYHDTGEMISAHNEEQRQNESPYNFCYFVLNDDRQKIYERIDQRVDLMLEEGLVDEVKALRDMGCHKDMVAMKGLGYKEILAYLEDEITLEEAIYIIKRDTRHFAKRQLTWFKREKEVDWIDKSAFDSKQDMLNCMLKMLKDKEIY